MSKEVFWQLMVSESMQWVIVFLNLAFVILIIKEKILAWIFGIVASVLSVIVFLSPTAFLPSEALLYSVYVVLGFYGWYKWSSNKGNEELLIITVPTNSHAKYIAVGSGIWVFLGYFSNKYTASTMPWADGFSTAFAFVATYLEARKILHSWIYWIILNLFSVWLYQARALNIMALMMAGFAIFSVIGWIAWQKKYQQQSSSKPV